MLGKVRICDHGWDENYARVVCNELKEDKFTKAMATVGGTFGGKNGDSKMPMWHVQCNGTESN